MNEDPLIRLAFPGEIVVDVDEIYLEELSCDPVPGCTSIPYRSHESCYSASASCSPAAKLASAVPQTRDRDGASAASHCSEHPHLPTGAMESDFLDVRSITSGCQAFSMLCDGTLSLAKYEEWAVHFFRWPTAPYCDFRR